MSVLTVARQHRVAVILLAVSVALAIASVSLAIASQTVPAVVTGVSASALSWVLVYRMRQV